MSNSKIKLTVLKMLRKTFAQVIKWMKTALDRIESTYLKVRHKKQLQVQILILKAQINKLMNWTIWKKRQIIVMLRV